MISVFSPRLSFTEKVAVFKSVLKNDISGTSPVVGKFEEEIAKKFDRKYAVAVSNGSVALDVALNTLDLKKGDEVIVPSFTIISCLSAIIRTGATPVFCDVDENTWNMTLELTEKKVTQNTKAILMVHLYGLAAEATKIENFCNENNLILIEDAAEAHGQIVDNKKCGSFGSVSTFSFYANKHITTGEGGAVLTDDEKVYKKIKKMINLDFDNSKRFQHNHLYWNYRMGGLQASLGLSQIKNLDKTINRKRLQGNYYNKLLNEFESFNIPLELHEGIKNHYWVYGVLLKQEGIRDGVVNYLESIGIQTRPFFWPLHLQPALPEKYAPKENNLKNSEFLGRNGFYIPIGDHLSKSKQKFISEKLIEVVSKYN